jgi:ABC-type transport system substrate-binding protein
LFEVGVDMDVELLSLETLIQRATAGKYDALLIPMYAGRTMDYTYRFWRSGIAEAQMVNSAYTGADELLDQLRGSLSDDSTKRVVHDLVNQFHADVPAVFLAWTEVTRAVSTRFDVGNSSRQDPFFNIWQWNRREVAASR